MKDLKTGLEGANKRIDDLDKKIDHVEEKLIRKINDVEERLTKKIDNF